MNYLVNWLGIAGNTILANWAAVDFLFHGTLGPSNIGTLYGVVVVKYLAKILITTGNFGHKVSLKPKMDKKLRKKMAGRFRNVNGLF